MAKGRKLTTSRSERYLGSYSYGNNAQGATVEVSELVEDDVWSTVADVKDGNDEVAICNSTSEWSAPAAGENKGGFSSRSNGRLRNSRDERHAGGLSLAIDDTGKTSASRIVHQLRGSNSMARSSPRGYQMATSAPVNVPDWSKIYSVDSVESMHDSGDERDMEMIPPHEYLARSKEMSGASVFEGVGRTLKGRDLRRVRDAVWSQTGFDG